MRRDLVGSGLAALPVGGGGGSQFTADVYFHADDLFSVTSVTDSSGGVVERADYGDYGERLLMDSAGALVTTPDPATNRISSRVGNPWWFTGRELDQETGLYQYRYRFMNPRIGRFVSRDPIGTWGDSSLSGSSGNYTASKPVFFVDPFGLWEDRYDGLDRNAIPAGPPNPTTGGPSNGSSGSNGTISRRGPSVPVEAFDAWRNGASIPSLWDANPKGGDIGERATDFGRDYEDSTGKKGSGNAARHAYWQAMLACKHGQEAAIAIGDAHEKGRQCDPDSRIDQYNNRVARRIASQNRGSCDMIFPKIKEALDNGDFIFDPNDPRVPPAPPECCK